MPYSIYETANYYHQEKKCITFKLFYGIKAKSALITYDFHKMEKVIYIMIYV